MSFSLGRMTDCEGRLQRDFSEFARLWGDVRADWQDDRCRAFEKDHLTSIGPSLSRFAAALHEFGDAVRKADAELTDPQG